MKLKIRKKMADCLVAGWFATSLACLAPPVGYGQETAQSKAKMQPPPMLTKAFGATLDTPVVYQATSATKDHLLLITRCPE